MAKTVLRRCTGRQGRQDRGAQEEVESPGSKPALRLQSAQATWHLRLKLAAISAISLSNP
ncbi:hypothetical protein [Nioella sp. MMSF_3534]|uniref:hypothetical protein n=1 Tax=Nioella sp. MMSF_3534 TaxID=3046720 RepID=UPI0027401968|nr:hypothetical protein [Nioella sp. MMSF_3534]